MCSGIRIICGDGSVIIARTLEFDMSLQYSTFSNEIGKGIVAHLPGRTDNYIIDGMNQYGITVMAFYFSGYTEYGPYDPDRVNLSSLDVAGFFLSNAKSIADIRDIARQISVLDEPYEGLGYPVPLHWFCCDKNGNCVVVECVKSIVTVYDNPYGIMANDPTFPEHISKIKQKNDINPYKSLIGLPGDFSSVSRFERLYVFQKFHSTPKCIHQGLNTTFHILNSFDIVKGVNIHSQSLKPIYTQYMVLYDVTNNKVKYKTYEDQTNHTF
jgi:choloylglycine hydrolase